MVTVVVLQSFSYHEHLAAPGDSLDMEPIDAAVHARLGHVSLLHGNTYQRKDMIASDDPAIVGSTEVLVPISTGDTAPDPPAPPKRRRGRPRTRPQE